VEAKGLDVVFSCLPHLKSAEMCAPFFGKTVVVDLSADFRLRDPSVFLKAYGAPMPKPELLGRSVYGLSEWYRDPIRNADIIANPGCYPTATLLPLLPLAREGLIKGTVIVNAISGISGAGKKEKADLLYCERAENANAYNPGTSHRHAPEISQELQAAGGPLALLFTPHMAPIRRGMAVTTVAELSRDPLASGAGSIEAIYRKYYEGRPFVSLGGGRIPQTREVWGSNRCDIGWRVEAGRVMLFSAIDNLVKGASGQAVQNMNIRFGVDESAGLRSGGEL
jgi:N-acetyl-gamma-glutamyl-phosphate reductase